MRRSARIAQKKDEDKKRSEKIVLNPKKKAPKRRSNNSSSDTTPKKRLQNTSSEQNPKKKSISSGDERKNLSSDRKGEPFMDLFPRDKRMTKNNKNDGILVLSDPSSSEESDKETIEIKPDHSSDSPNVQSNDTSLSQNSPKNESSSQGNFIKERKRRSNISNEKATHVLPTPAEGLDEEEIDINIRNTPVIKKLKGEERALPKRRAASRASLKLKEDNFIGMSSDSSSLESEEEEETLYTSKKKKETKPTRKRSKNEDDMILMPSSSSVDSSDDEMDYLNNMKKEKTLRPSKEKNSRKKPIKRKSKESTPTGIRAVTHSKPNQPWKKNLASYEKTRRQSKGERRMAVYRIIAKILAKGRTEEISTEECYRLNADLKQAYQKNHDEMECLSICNKLDDKEEVKDGGSSSEDEWEDMEHFEPVVDDKIEVTLETTKAEEEKDWWVVYLRQEINKCIRNVWEQTHQTHLLCYMVHLRLVAKNAMDESLLPSLMLSQLPSGYEKYRGKRMGRDIVKKMVSWYRDSYRVGERNGMLNVQEGHEARFAMTERWCEMATEKTIETDLDRAVLLFAILISLEASARICVNLQAIPRKFVKQEDVHQPQKNQKSSKSKKEKEFRNYWCEYWDTLEKRWIPVDPLEASVDEPFKISESCSSMSYVFAIDNHYGICDVTQRYSLDLVKPDYRRRRTDVRWLAKTLKLPPFRADEEMVRLEKMQLRQDLTSRPLPNTLAEYKNHPLYVLEKDLLKFEAIYPPVEEQKPLGDVRGHKVYPRSTVYTLQGENNWLKLARSVKKGEKPYKVVKARPDFRVPAEERVQKFLDVFGYWQTEPYRRPTVKNGKIPRNEYGNVYMFHESMCPIGCVYLRLPGLVQIARRIDKECVQAVVGWAFDGGWTHPVMDGAVVLEEDAEQFVKEWSRTECDRIEKEQTKRLQRIYQNWKTLFKGVLRLKYLRDTFKNIKDNKEDAVKVEEEPIDMDQGPQPLSGFSLDDFINNKR